MCTNSTVSIQNPDPKSITIKPVDHNQRNILVELWQIKKEGKVYWFSFSYIFDTYT